MVFSSAGPGAEKRRAPAGYGAAAIRRARPYPVQASGSIHSSWRRQKLPDFKQHFLKCLPDPQGHGSFLPSFSTSSLSPWTILMPRLTCVSDGNPFLRLLVTSKANLFDIFGFHDCSP
jgi:hypothetical protein